MIRAVEDVEEALPDEAARRLAPGWIEGNPARIAEELVRAQGAAGRPEAQNRNDARGQPLQAGAY